MGKERLPEYNHTQGTYLTPPPPPLQKWGNSIEAQRGKIIKKNEKKNTTLQIKTTKYQQQKQRRTPLDWFHHSFHVLDVKWCPSSCTLVPCTPLRQVSAVAFDTDGLTLGVGTSSAHCLMFDLRSPRPSMVKEHQYGLPVTKITFHQVHNTKYTYVCMYGHHI